MDEFLRLSYTGILVTLAIVCFLPSLILQNFSCVHAKTFAIFPSVSGFRLLPGKMLPLFHNGTIDDKLYKLWLDDKKKEYENVHMRNEDELEEFELLHK